MDQLLDLLLRNPWLILLIVFGVLGNLGQSPAQKAAKRKRAEERARRHRELRERLDRERSGHDPFAEEAVDESRRRVEQSGDEVSKRIREILGRAQGAPAPEAERPVPVAASPRVADRGGEFVGGLAATTFEVEEMAELEVSDFQGYADTLTEMDNRPAQALPADISPPRQARLPRGLKPNQFLLAQLLMGPPRAFEEYSDQQGLLR